MVRFHAYPDNRDPGDIFIQQGKKAEALDQFRFVYGLDADYRDVALKVHD